MQKILGLDIGSYSIKAVEILNTFKAYKVTKFYEIAVPEIDGLDQQLVGMTAVKQLFTENDLDADRTYTAMMGLLVSMRVLNLQNVKRRMLPQIVENELETNAPFSLDDVVIDQQIIDSKDGNTSVLAVMCRKDHVEAYLSGLKELDIEPKIIDVDYLSFLNLYPFLQFEEDASPEQTTQTGKKSTAQTTPSKCRLLIDIGHLKTSMVLFNNGKLVTARTIRMGGRYFTDALQKSLGVTFNEAQRLKHAVSYVEYRPESKAKPGFEREFLVAKNLGVAATELLKELIRTMHSFKAQERLVPDSIVITGGSTAIRNLPEFLQEMLEIPVNRMVFDSARLKIDDVELIKSPSIAQALAVGLRGVPGKVQSSINLRKGEMALVGSYDTIIKQITNVALLVASLMICLVGSYGLRWWLYGKQIDQLKDQYRKEVTKILGTEPRNLKNMAATGKWDIKSYSSSAFKIVTDETKSRETILKQYSSRQSALPLRVLEDISKIISKEVLIDVTQYSLQGSQVILEGETDSFTTSEKILSLLKTLPIFSDVERKSQENKPGSEGKIVKFTVLATLKEGT
jgi:type IV pilus assembly protein PilM